MRKWAWWSALAIVIVIVAAAFLYGPLFPWSPIKPGYTHFTLHRADVYYPTGTTLEDAYQQMDSFIEDAEKFHRLKMPDRVKVIAPRRWADFHRQAPWQRGPVGAITLQTGTVIFVTPKLAEKHLDTGEFLRHELSHAILDQNMTLWRGHKMNQQSWLSEGLAVDFGRQRSYLSEEEFLSRAQTESLAPVFNGNNSDMCFNYLAWRYFLEHLIRTRGRDIFQDFLLRAMENPDDVRTVFPEFFGTTFDGAVSEFQAKVRASRSL
jgi:hypothetical protein